MVGPATGKALLPTVDSFTDGTSRRLVRAGKHEILHRFSTAPHDQVGGRLEVPHGGHQGLLILGIHLQKLIV